MRFDISSWCDRICQLITPLKNLKLKDNRGNLERLIVFTLLDY